MNEHLTNATSLDYTYYFTTLALNNLSTIREQTDQTDDTNQGYTLRYGIIATIVLSIAYCSVFIIGVFGNIAVFIVVKRTPRMRTLTNQFIANLAIADLLVNFLCLPFTLVANLFPEAIITFSFLLYVRNANAAWALGIFFCKTVSYFQGVSVSASVNTLMAISIERCLAISCPLSASMSSRQYKCSVAAIWTVALTINLPWLFVFHLEPISNGSNLKVCTELWPSPRTENLFFIMANLILCYLGPLTVISICYVIIWRKVANRSVPGEHMKHATILNTINKSRLKVTKMVFVVIITFALSWFPLYAIFCIIKFCEDIYKHIESIIIFLLPIAQWLGASNSCINPIVYAYMNRKFRLCFLNLFKKTPNRFNEAADDIALRNYRWDSNNCRMVSARRQPRQHIVLTNSTKTSTNTSNRNIIVTCSSPQFSRMGL